MFSSPCPHKRRTYLCLGIAPRCGRIVAPKFYQKTGFFEVRECSSALGWSSLHSSQSLLSQSSVYLSKKKPRQQFTMIHSNWNKLWLEFDKSIISYANSSIDIKCIILYRHLNEESRNKVWKIYHHIQFTGNIIHGCSSVKACYGINIDLCNVPLHYSLLRIEDVVERGSKDSQVT